jgi:hypothetical protein
LYATDGVQGPRESVPWNSGHKTATYDPVTGRILCDVLIAGPSGIHSFAYDSAGNTLWVKVDPVGTVANESPSEDRVSYYDADNVLRATDYRHIDVALTFDSPIHRTFDEYRYDALGRRVWARARLNCSGFPPFTTTLCDESV